MAKIKTQEAIIVKKEMTPTEYVGEIAQHIHELIDKLCNRKFISKDDIKEHDDYLEIAAERIKKLLIQSKHQCNTNVIQIDKKISEKEQLHGRV